MRAPQHLADELASHGQVSLVVFNQGENLSPLGAGADLAISPQLFQKRNEAVSGLPVRTELLVLLLLPGVVESAFQSLHVILENGQHVKLAESLVFFVVLEGRGG